MHCARLGRRHQLRHFLKTDVAEMPVEVATAPSGNRGFSLPWCELPEKSRH